MVHEANQRKSTQAQEMRDEAKRELRDSTAHRRGSVPPKVRGAGTALPGTARPPRDVSAFSSAYASGSTSTFDCIPEQPATSSTAAGSSGAAAGPPRKCSVRV